MKNHIDNNEELTLADILFDEENCEPITVTDNNGKEVKFNQVATIPLDNDVYCILHPIDKVEGLEEDEALVFQAFFVDECGKDELQYVEDEQISQRVFDEYYKLIEYEE